MHVGCLIFTDVTSHARIAGGDARLVVDRPGAGRLRKAWTQA